MEKINTETTVNETLVGQLTGWTDVCLIPDTFCSWVMNTLPRRYFGWPKFDAIVIDNDMIEMWNVDSSYTQLNPKIDLNRAIYEKPRPFWLDEQGIVHLIPSNLMLTKTELPLEGPLEQPIENNLKNPFVKSSHIMDKCPVAALKILAETIHSKTELDRLFKKSISVRILPDNKLDEALNKQPNLQLLLVDQFEKFVDDKYQAHKGLVWIFTGEPPTNVYETHELRCAFYERLLHEQRRLFGLLLNADDKGQPKKEIQSKTNSTSTIIKKSRNCNIVWSSFIPSVDYISNIKHHVHSTDLHLFNDGGNKMFWRNIVYTFLRHQAEDEVTDEANISKRIRVKDKGEEDEDMEAQVTQNENTMLSSTTVKQENHETLEGHIILIRLRFDDIPPSKSKDGSNVRINHAVVRRFKRFAAYLSHARRILEKSNTTSVKTILWTCCARDIDHVYWLHNVMTKEYIHAYRVGLFGYDRYMKTKGIDKLIKSPCPLERKSPNNWKCSDENSNIQGIVHETLVADEFFGSPIKRIGRSSLYLQKSTCGAPIYKLRDYEG